jgi:hypothetical protein
MTAQNEDGNDQENRRRDLIRDVSSLLGIHNCHMP